MQNTGNNDQPHDRANSDPVASPDADSISGDHQIQKRPRDSNRGLFGTILGWLAMLLILVPLVVWLLNPPMMSGQSEQSRQTITKSYMSEIKIGLVQFMADVGRVPHLGGANDFDDAHVHGADAVLDTAADRNVLWTDTIKGVADWQMMGYSSTAWKKRWKGPYMKTEPSNFMVDAWNHRMHFRVCRSSTYLWSAGPDGKFDDLALLVQELATQSDDIVMTMTPLKGPGFATDTVTCPLGWEYAAALNVNQPVATAAESAGRR